MFRTLQYLIIVMSLYACEHSGQNITQLTGDYRYYNGVAEFFDCSERKKYYVSDSGISRELRTAYEELKLLRGEDIYLKIEGYYKEEEQIPGIDPALVFVPVELIEINKDRGCERYIRKGS